MNDNKPTPTKRLRVYAIDEDEQPAAPTPTPAPVMDTESWVNFWLLSLLAIAGVGGMAYFAGWLKPPQQATLDKLEQTQQQLTATQTELQRLQSCIKK